MPDKEEESNTSNPPAGEKPNGENTSDGKTPDDGTAGDRKPTEAVLSAETFMTDNAGLPKQNAEESRNSKFAALSARVTKTAQTSNKIKWNKIKGADGYVVYGAKCNTGSKKYKFEVLTITEKNSTTSYTHKKLQKGTGYKYIVQAYQISDGKVQILTTSKTIHSITTGGKYGNVSSLKLNKTKVTLKAGKKVTLKATEKNSGKKIKRHRQVAYESSNTKVAAVNKKGVITAKKKGTCYIYVYAQNGVYKKVKVTVKK